jgi:hypothetical protein
MIMRAPSLGPPNQRLVRRLVTLLAGLLLAGARHPGRLAAQANPYALEDVQLWIESGVKPARVLGMVRTRCIGFRMDATAESVLRGAGASAELLNGLRGVCQRPPQMVMEQPPAARREDTRPAPGRQAQGPSRYSREVLRPLYYGSPAAITVFGSSMKPEWTGDEPGPWAVEFPGGSTGTVRVPPAPADLVTYGLSVGAADGIRLDGEMYLHQNDFTFILGGLELEPFIPIGRTRFRAIVGATGLVGVAKQSLAVEDGGGEVFSDSLDLTSVLAGGDGRLGLAYHPHPGFWIFAEARYRYMTTVSRQLGVEGSSSVSDLSWPKLTFRGPSLRIGIGL